MAVMRRIKKHKNYKTKKSRAKPKKQSIKKQSIKTVKKRFFQDKLTTWLLLILVVGFMFRVILFVDRTSLWWDSGVYIGMGKYMFSSGRSGLMEEIRPPLIPFMLGLGWFIGLSPFWLGIFLNLVSWLLVSLTVFFIARYLLPKKFDFLSLIPVALINLDFGIAMLNTQIYTDLIALMFTTIALFMFLQYMKKPCKLKALSIGILSGLAFLTRFTHIFIFFAVVTGFVILILIELINRKLINNYKKNKASKSILYKRAIDKAIDGGMVILGFSLLIALYLVYNKVLFGSFLKPLTTAFDVARESKILEYSNIVFYIKNIFDISAFSLLGFLALAVFIKPSLLEYDTKKKLVLGVVYVYLLSSFLFHSLIAHKEVRYGVAFTTMLYLLSGVSLAFIGTIISGIKSLIIKPTISEQKTLKQKTKNKKQKLYLKIRPNRFVIVTVVVCLIATLMVIQPLIIIISKTFFIIAHHPDRTIEGFYNELSNIIPKEAVVISSTPVVSGFINNRVFVIYDGVNVRIPPTKTNGARYIKIDDFVMNRSESTLYLLFSLEDYHTDTATTFSKKSFTNALNLKKRLLNNSFDFHIRPMIKFKVLDYNSVFWDHYLFRVEKPLNIIFRVDDACNWWGWNNSIKVLRLLSNVNASAIVAVIPLEFEKLTPDMRKTCIKLLENDYNNKNNGSLNNNKDNNKDKHDNNNNNRFLIAEHGFNHKNTGFFSEFYTLDYKQQSERIIKGREILKTYFGNSTNITIFVPPFNIASFKTLEVLQKLGFRFYSSHPLEPAVISSKLKKTSLNILNPCISFEYWELGNSTRATNTELVQSFEKARAVGINPVIILLHPADIDIETFKDFLRFLEFLRKHNDIQYMKPKNILKLSKENTYYSISGCDLGLKLEVSR